ncbi:cytochrome c maturation protein CcmE [Marinomonas sp. IMCC 4694]|uniref:cytochrome c maturation protein CcmE n=1 Tax=Marinomonas sp. IMCC 4694 TaxID=2605432 RepID=UPI0011E665CC|nr:cytochrome c maturation protein CcmE [Marinomonas sp. IMCC 4694]TYL48471.1 cytochrome c maturation protein CcmE [Marinomonas sp. IMCC 4694]
MHSARKKRLLVVIVILMILSAATGLVLYALQQNINLFFSPTQIAAGEAPQHAVIRAGGVVVNGSVKRDTQTLAVSFDVTDYQYAITIEYKGILPDLFREGQGIVAQGKMRADGVFEATQVLAKHDEEYMPPEVSAALKNAPTKGVMGASSAKPAPSLY